MSTRSFSVWVTVVCLLQVPAVAQDLHSGVYATAADAMVQECGDQIVTGSACQGFPNLQGRILPFSAMVTLDLDGLSPHMSATIHNAVWEGGDPFELQLQAPGVPTPNGLRFSGNYFPANSGYFFDWEFTADSDGSVFLDGSAYWSGGHWWQLDYDQVALILVPEPPAGGMFALALWLLVNLSFRF